MRLSVPAYEACALFRYTTPEIDVDSRTTVGEGNERGFDTAGLTWRPTTHRSRTKMIYDNYAQVLPVCLKSCPQPFAISRS